MPAREPLPLSSLTTLRLGGPPRRYFEAESDGEVLEIFRALPPGEPVLVLGGGSNLVVADEGFEGTVVRIATRGITFEDRDEGAKVRVHVAAGESWDALVEACVARGLAGLECLSGIPGLVGATPIQNVGAYGVEVSDTLVRVVTLDRRTMCRVHVPAAACGFGYRTSVFRGGDRHVVLAVVFELRRAAATRVPPYAELRRALGADDETEVALADVRRTVIALRAGKGMVLSPADPDSVSAGSFFTNPLLAADEVAPFLAKVRGHLGPDAAPPLFPDPASGKTKTSAAWLIERAGFARGFGEGRVGLSTKHTLALVNRGGGSTHELCTVARAVRDGVQRVFGVVLEPEPIFVGFPRVTGASVLDA